MKYSVLFSIADKTNRILAYAKNKDKGRLIKHYMNELDVAYRSNDLKIMHDLLKEIMLTSVNKKDTKSMIIDKINQLDIDECKEELIEIANNLFDEYLCMKGLEVKSSLLSIAEILAKLARV